MSDVVLNSQLLMRLVTGGEEEFKCVSVLKVDTTSTVCELTMLILSIYVTFSVICLTVASLIMKSCQQGLTNTFFFILQGSELGDLGCSGRF